MFYTKTIMLSVNKHSFRSLFPIWMPFLSFSCLFALARTSRLKRLDNRRHSCPVPIIKGKAFILSLLSICLPEGFVPIFSAEEVVFCCCFDESFYQDWSFNFVKCFCSHIELTIWLFGSSC